jgi:putative membrane protein
MMVKNLVICSIAAVASAFLLCAQPKSSPSVNTSDSMFLRQAAEINLAEVELGQFAKENASAQTVKDFAQRMITDHSNAQHTLKMLAAGKNVTLPDQLDAKDMALYTRLTKLSGTAFDRAYINAMVQGHTQAVAKFKSESKAATDPDVRSYASNTLPTLEEHLKLAHQAAVQIGATSRR